MRDDSMRASGRASRFGRSSRAAMFGEFLEGALLLALAALLPGSANAQQAAPAPQASEAAKPANPPAPAPGEPVLEPKAIAILKASSRRLAAARTMSFTAVVSRSEEHTSELQSRPHLVCRLLLEKKKWHRLCLTPCLIQTPLPR